MLIFLKANAGTIAVALILAVIVFLIIRKMIKDKKEGKGTCGGDCSKCHSCSHRQ